MNHEEADLENTRAKTRLINAQAAELEYVIPTQDAGEGIKTRPRETFGIGRAIDEMQQYGTRISRSGWNGPDQFLELRVPDWRSKMTLPYIFISTVQGDLVPWLASQTDILAVDWYVVVQREATA